MKSKILIMTHVVVVNKDSSLIKSLKLLQKRERFKARLNPLLYKNT